MREPSIIGLSGSLRTPSRTTALMIEVLGRIAARRATPAQLIEVAGIAPALAAARAGEAMTAQVSAVIEAVEEADILVLGSPVYRASVTTVARDLFALIRPEALRGTAVLLVAIGGEGPRALIPEAAFRPLEGLAFARLAPIGVHAAEEDFDGTRLTGAGIPERIARAVAGLEAMMPAGVLAGIEPAQLGAR